MHLLQLALSLLAAAPAVLAFPFLQSGVSGSEPGIAARHYPHTPITGAYHSCPRAKQKGRKFVLPDPIANFTSQVIPDKDHPYRAPRQRDERGPCPALNTLANHGYIPRNGVATTEQIIKGVMQGFGMSRDVAAFLAAFGTLARGNANTATLSIGAASDLVPPLPNCIDGPIAGGLSKPGRIEGDVSLSRRDAGPKLGNAARFDARLYDQLLLYAGRVGVSAPTGTNAADASIFTANSTAEAIVTSDVFAKYIPSRFAFELANDKALSFTVGRQLIAYAATALVLELFPSFPGGIKGNLTVAHLSSFFRDERFPSNWVRRAPPANLIDVVPTAGGLIAAHKIKPGRKVNGVFTETKDFTLDTVLCDGYNDIMKNSVPEVLIGPAVTGIFKENVEALLAAMVKPFADLAGCKRQQPKGKAGI